RHLSPLFLFNDTTPPDIHTLSLHDALPIFIALLRQRNRLTYRLVKREFALDDATLEDLKDELIYAQKLAVEEDERELPFHKAIRSEEHTSELQSLTNIVCRLLLEKKKESNC